MIRRVVYVVDYEIGQFAPLLKWMGGGLWRGAFRAGAVGVFILGLAAACLACCGGGAWAGEGGDKAQAGDAMLAKGDSVLGLSNNISVIYEARNGDYWFGSETDGVHRYDGKQIVRYNVKVGLATASIREIKEDKAGAILIATQQGAIFKFDGQVFTRLVAKKGDGAMAHWRLDSDDVWLRGGSMKNGMYRYDGETLYDLEFPKHFMADGYYKQFPNSPWSPYEVYCIYRDKKGNMWFGTSNFGICRYDGEKLSWLYDKDLTETPEGGSFGIRSIAEDSDGKFWFCNSKYRYTIRKKDQEKGLISYLKEPGVANLRTSAGKDKIYYLAIARGKGKEIWMATFDQGIWQYDGTKIRRYPIVDGANSEGAAAINPTTIYKDKKGGLWVGTQQAGVFKYDGKVFVKFVPAN